MKLSATYSAMDCPLDDLVGLLCSNGDADAQLGMDAPVGAGLPQPDYSHVV
jgi:hypothetical protein